MSKRDKLKDYFDTESVDVELMLSFLDEMGDSKSSTDELIDKFLELKDLRIIVDDESEVENIDVDDVVIGALDCASDCASGDIPSEELAEIYYKQGLYREAKDIYSQLFLLYSEKIAYFATQIERIDSLAPIEGGES